MKKPLLQNDTARKPAARQQKLGQGTYQPGWEMPADVEDPFFLRFSEARGEEAIVGFAERWTIFPARGKNGIRREQP